MTRLPCEPGRRLEDIVERMEARVESKGKRGQQNHTKSTKEPVPDILRRSNSSRLPPPLPHPHPHPYPWPWGWAGQWCSPPGFAARRCCRWATAAATPPPPSRCTTPEGWPRGCRQALAWRGGGSPSTATPPRKGEVISQPMPWQAATGGQDGSPAVPKLMPISPRTKMRK